MTVMNKPNGEVTSTSQANEKTPLTYSINRNVMQYHEFTEISGFERHKLSRIETIKKHVKDFNCGKCVKDTIPAVHWLPNYSFRNKFMGDLMAGITVAVMHIPQGMAYGILAGLTPSVGLYMAFFPTLMYFLFGTSRHISTGTFAVISIMVSKIVHTYANVTSTDTPESNFINATAESQIGLPDGYTPFQVATAVTMAAGLMQLVMCCFRLGTLASLLSKPLVSAFTCAAAVHVLVSQIKDLLGIDVQRYSGAFKIILTLIDIVRKLAAFNPVAVYISISVMAFMIVMNEYVKPKMATICKFPVPAELIAVVGATIVSKLVGFGPNYSVKLVGTIPLGLPTPEVPPFELVKLVAVDSIAVCVVSFSIAISMALIFAQKQFYEVRPNQELLAFGLSNVVGSLFSCIPLAASLSRSVIQEQTGGNTQLASVVSASIILVLLLWLGPFFETLPKCVLAGVIIVALKSLFLQVYDLKKFYSQSTLEAIVWLVTFLSVVLIDIDLGLLLGVVMSIAVLYIKGYKAYSSVLGQIPDTDIYADIQTHSSAKEIANIKIFRYCGAVNFASKSNFKKAVHAVSKVDHRLMRRASSILDPSETVKLYGHRAVIIDLSAIPHMDFSGCQTLTELKNEFNLLGAEVYLTSPRDNVYDTILHAQCLGEGPFNIYPTIHDAVIYQKSS